MGHSDTAGRGPPVPPRADQVLGSRF